MIVIPDHSWSTSLVIFYLLSLSIRKKFHLLKRISLQNIFFQFELTLSKGCFEQAPESQDTEKKIFPKGYMAPLILLGIFFSIPLRPNL